MFITDFRNQEGIDTSKFENENQCLSVEIKSRKNNPYLFHFKMIPTPKSWLQIVILTSVRLRISRGVIESCSVPWSSWLKGNSGVPSWGCLYPFGLHLPSWRSNWRFSWQISFKRSLEWSGFPISKSGKISNENLATSLLNFLPIWWGWSCNS